MDRTLNVAVAGAAMTVVLLTLFYGPVVTAFIVAGASFVLMIGLIALAGFHAFERWRHGHPWTLHRTKTH